MKIELDNKPEFKIIQKIIDRRKQFEYFQNNQEYETNLTQEEYTFKQARSINLLMQYQICKQDTLRSRSKISDDE